MHGELQPAKSPEARSLGGFPALRAGVESSLAALAAKHRRRGLTSAEPGFLDLTHNDYLALRQDADLQAEIHGAVRNLPVGSGGSRLLGGDHPVFAALEREMAAFKGAPDALFFPSGYAANEAVATALARLPDAAFFSDALNHASLIDGIRLSGLPKERRHVFGHGSLAELEEQLAASPAEINCIFTESVFSMDGDIADLPGLGRLAEKYRGVLVIDEAHAVFALGPKGRGLAGQAGLPPDALITVDTCGKALAAQGAFVSAPTWFKDFLVNVARPFIYTTAPSPWLAEALRQTLSRSAQYEARRARLTAVASRVRSGLAALGFATGSSETHIVPVLLGSDQAALAASTALKQRGIVARAIRPPTVPEGTARLRLSLNAGLTDADLERLLKAFAELGGRRG